MDVRISFENFGDCVPVEHIELYSDDLKAVNDAECENVSPVKTEVTKEKKQCSQFKLEKAFMEYDNILI